MPVGNLLRIDTELVCMILALYLLIEQPLPNAGPRNPKTRYPVNRIDCQAEAVRLVLDGQLQRRVDVPLFLVTRRCPESC